MRQELRYKYWPYLLYPATIIICMGLFFVLCGVGLHLLACTYIPVGLAAVIIACFEYYAPYRRAWAANGEDIREDALFIVAVQMALPKILVFTVAISVLQLLNRFEFRPEAMWPHHWGIGLQAALMVLVADFFRYWLHRFSHNNAILWRLHAVHHAPVKLYWANVGRFHPLEKGLQFFFDALPFILVGVGQEVIALYFVFYAVNGFFQHSNVELRLGWLNYFISGPELHRWHHSRNGVESSHNFGNNIIIWDIIFSTYFWPCQGQVQALGLANQDYPRGFGAQLMAPFSGLGGILTIKKLGAWLLNLLLRLRMQWVRIGSYRTLVRAAEDPGRVQRQVLGAILKRNAATEFGREHGFGDIEDWVSYTKRVPVCQYEDLRPYIERQEQEKVPALTSEQPILYNRTSGTTGEPKHIPVLKSTLEALRRSQQIFSYVQYKGKPDGFAGKMLGLVSPALEGHLAGGTPWGSASGHIYQTMPKIARAKYALPEEVFSIGDYDIKYYVIARLAIAQEDITCLASANPTTFHRLLETIERHWVDLVCDIKRGGCKYLDELDPDTVRAMGKDLGPNPKRAQILEGLFSGSKEVGFGDFWPHLKLLFTWTGGSCGRALNGILPKFPVDIRVADLGFLASEVRGTIPMDSTADGGLPTIDENFFEFVEKERWEEGRPQFLTIDRLKVGGQYYLFVTTPAGLYRYDMNDIVEVAGFFAKTPTLRFVQKGKGATNLTGEKLYESQVNVALLAAEDTFGLKLKFYQMLADEGAFRYELYFEATSPIGVDSDALGSFLEEMLCRQNIEYETKRADRRLGPLLVQPLQAGTFETYKQHCLAKGQRESQFKSIVLQYKRDFDFDLSQSEVPC